jgi:xanthine dehydrogenase molybdopterin-binding subunit B
MNRSIKCILERYDDMALTGTRHPMLAEYRVAVDATTLRLRKLEMNMYSNCGHSPDLSISVIRQYLIEWSTTIARPKQTHSYFTKMRERNR